MATKKELSSYRSKELKTAAQQQNEYEATRNAQISSAYKTQAALIDAQTKQTTAQYRDQIGKADSEYQALYDANAVNELIARRQVEERMANLGLSDSGLNRTQLTATAVTRSTADAAVGRKKQEYVDRLNQLITETMAQGEQEKLRQKAELTAKAQSDIEEYRLKTLQWAEDRAQDSHDADYRLYKDYYDRFSDLGMEETLARDYAKALAYGNESEVETARKEYANTLAKQKSEKELEDYIEKRRKYAELLIRYSIYPKTAWQEAYLLYPEKEEEKK